MGDESSEQTADSRPRVTGSFVEPDEKAVPMLIAMGRVVFAAAGLEKALQLEIARLVYARLVAANVDISLAFAKELARLGDLTAGALLRELRAHNLSTEPHDRIDGAIKRRNDLVHRTFEDPELAKAAAGDGNFDSVVIRFNQLAVDCGELAVELQAFAIPKLEELFGMSRRELADIVLAADPSKVVDPRERRQLETIQAFGDPHALSAARDDLGSFESAEES